jgi:FeS assembly SUF system protein
MSRPFTGSDAALRGVAGEKTMTTTATSETTMQEHEPTPAPATATAPGAGAPASGPVDVQKLEVLIIDALHTVYDPEIPVDIYELGLIYSIDISPEGKVAITMTLTTPACPVAGSMPGQVEKTVRMIEGVTDVVVDLVWEPVWGPAMMTESARLQLNMY